MRTFLKLPAAVTFLCSTLAATSAVTIPAPLHPGDCVAIISPSSTPEPSYIEGAARALRQWGFRPVVGKNALASQGAYAGSVEQRLSDLRWAFETDSIKAIMCSRGGYGAVHLFCELPHGYFAAHPKWLIGYSDITALLSAMVTDGVAGIHGHMGEYLRDNGPNDSVALMLKQALSPGSIDSYSLPTKPLSRIGEASGTLIGGNLSVFNDLLGSEWDFTAIDGDIILFIEDTHETLLSIDRMLYHLKINGILDRINGLIVGDFHGYRPTGNYQNVEQLVAAVMSYRDIPIAMGFPTGHVDANFPLIVGANVTLKVTPHTTTLQFNTDSEAAARE